MAVIKIDGSIRFGVQDTDDKLHVVKVAGNGVEDVKEIDFS